MSLIHFTYCKKMDPTQNFTSFLHHWQDFYQTKLWVTWWASYKKQELLTLHKQLGSFPCFSGTVGFTPMFFRNSWVHSHVFQEQLGSLPCFSGAVGFIPMFFRNSWVHSYVFKEQLGSLPCFSGTVGFTPMFFRNSLVHSHVFQFQCII